MAALDSSFPFICFEMVVLKSTRMSRYGANASAFASRNPRDTAAGTKQGILGDSFCFTCSPQSHSCLSGGGGVDFPMLL